MFLKVSAASVVSLEDIHNFRSFKVVVAMPDVELDAVRRALADVAALPARDTAWVSEQALRGWSGLADDAQWQAAFSAMVEKARPHGWIDDTRKAIKAHVEWTA